MRATNPQRSFALKEAKRIYDEKKECVDRLAKIEPDIITVGEFKRLFKSNRLALKPSSGKCGADCAKASGYLYDMFDIGNPYSTADLEYVVDNMKELNDLYGSVRSAIALGDVTSDQLEKELSKLRRFTPTKRPKKPSRYIPDGTDE